MFFAGKKVENCEVIEEDDQEGNESDVENISDENDDVETNETDSVNKKPGYQIHSENKHHSKANKIVAEVKSKMAVKNTTVDDSDDDFDDNVERTVNKISDDVIKTRDENQQKDVDKTSKKNESVKKVNDLNIDPNGSSCSSGQANGDIESAINANQDLKKGSSKKGVKFSDESVTGVNECESVNQTVGEQAGKGGSGRKSKGKKKREVRHEVGDDKSSCSEGEEKSVSKSEVDTELSWQETNKNCPSNAHRTKCAFDFSNAVMFDLDID